MSVRRRNFYSLAVVLLLFAAVGVAQDKKAGGSAPHGSRGVVEDKSDSPISGSVVFLKNVRHQFRPQQLHG